MISSQNTINLLSPAIIFDIFRRSVATPTKMLTTFYELDADSITRL